MEPGNTIGKYRLVSRLGRGGMGEVWLATANGYSGFAKTVVLKTLLPELASDPLFIEMLAQEARTCAKLSHPNLIEVFDFTKHDGIHLLAMEHVTGRPLSRIMKAARSRSIELPVWFALRVAWECCRGLECAHDQGVIHCDLSPNNVMVTFTGVTKILDFGVAHTSARGAKPDRLKGKLPYMAPERIKSLTTDARTDVYSLGVMLYLLVTGRLPFAANTDAELMTKIVTQSPPRPSRFCAIAPEIEQVILRAMERDPDARHQTIGELRGALTRCLEGQLGAFGQHDVAELVGNLFDTPESLDTLAVPRLPPIPAVTPGISVATVARLPRVPRVPLEVPVEIDSADVVSIDIGSVIAPLESSVLEIRMEQPPASRGGHLPLPADAEIGAFRSDVRATSSIQPLTKPVTAFVPLFDSNESRTTVQSLFGERPPTALGHSRVFERPDRDSQSHEALGSAPGRRIEPRTFGDPLHEWELDVSTAGPSPHGGSRSAEAWQWPWPNSRTKAE